MGSNEFAVELTLRGVILRFQGTGMVKKIMLRKMHLYFRNISQQFVVTKHMPEFAEEDVIGFEMYDKLIPRNICITSHN